MIGFALLAVSAVLLVAGAELFVDNAAGAARRLGVTVFAVGLLLAGAEPEEMLTGILASLAHRPGLAVGDALGANITMLTLTLGLAAVIRPVPLRPPGAVLRRPGRGRRRLRNPGPGRWPGDPARGRSAAGGVRGTGGGDLAA